MLSDDGPANGLTDLKAARRLFKGRRVLDEQELLTLKLRRREQGRLVPTVAACRCSGANGLFIIPMPGCSVVASLAMTRVIFFDRGNLFDS